MAAIDFNEQQKRLLEAMGTLQHQHHNRRTKRRLQVLDKKRLRVKTVEMRLF
jgi:uncharacterized protein YjiS (DUF1127 family)